MERPLVYRFCSLIEHKRFSLFLGFPSPSSHGRDNTGKRPVPGYVPPRYPTRNSCDLTTAHLPAASPAPSASGSTIQLGCAGFASPAKEEPTVTIALAETSPGRVFSRFQPNE
jgi:hypothetical protein